jgi:hypothetical protein
MTHSYRPFVCTIALAVGFFSGPVQAMERPGAPVAAPTTHQQGAVKKQAQKVPSIVEDPVHQPARNKTRAAVTQYYWHKEKKKVPPIVEDPVHQPAWNRTRVAVTQYYWYTNRGRHDLAKPYLDQIALHAKTIFGPTLRVEVRDGQVHLRWRRGKQGPQIEAEKRRSSPNVAQRPPSEPKQESRIEAEKLRSSPNAAQRPTHEKVPDPPSSHGPKTPAVRPHNPSLTKEPQIEAEKRRSTPNSAQRPPHEKVPDPPSSHGPKTPAVRSRNPSPVRPPDAPHHKKAQGTHAHSPPASHHGSVKH